MACAVDLDYFISEVCNIADAVKAKRRSDKTITLSLDEWNVWQLTAHKNPENWEIAPKVIEDEYTVADAVVVGNLLISILRRSDRVKIACMAQLVNVIAPIRTEPDKEAWRQTIFFPFAYTARYGKGKTLITRIDSDILETKRYGSVPTIDAITTYDEAAGQVAIFVVNRALTQSNSTSIQLSGFKDIELLDQVTIADTDLTKSNGAENPTNVSPDTSKSAKISGEYISVELAPASWQVIHVSAKPAD